MVFYDHILSFFAIFGGDFVAKESAFQAQLKQDLSNRFPGCMILKNDPNQLQGVPDLLVLFGNKWAALECKRSANAGHQPNQDFYVGYMNRMSYASFVSPENKEQVLDELQHALGPDRTTCVSKCK